MRAVELPSTSRSCSSTTAAPTARATCSASSPTAPCASSTTTRTAARARRSAPASSTSPATSCSCRTPTSSTTPRTGPSCSRRCCAGKAQVVYGSRFTGERRNMLFLHWVGNRFLSLVTNVLYNTTLSDMETCYKLFDRRVLDGITFRATRFDFEPEVTAKVLRRGHPHLRGADLVHRPRVRRGQEDHLARRLRRAVDPRQVPLRRLAASWSDRSRRTAVGGGGRELRSGPAARGCVRSLLADTSAGDPEVVVVDNGSRDGSVAALAASSRPSACVDPGREPRVRGRRRTSASRPRPRRSSRS